jgi:hypothetical protein
MDSTKSFLLITNKTLMWHSKRRKVLPINRWKTRLQLIFKTQRRNKPNNGCIKPYWNYEFLRKRQQSNFLAQYTWREEHFTEEAFTKEPNEFQRLFELKKNEDQNNIKNGDYDPEFKRYYCLHPKTTTDTFCKRMPMCPVPIN